METMSMELTPEKRTAFVQAVGALMGDFLGQQLAGGGSSSAELNERLDRMGGMTVDDIIAYAEEVRVGSESP